MTTVLIDGDILVFKCGCPHCSTTQWDPGKPAVLTMNVEAAVSELQAQVREIVRNTSADNFRIFLTMGKSFRNDLLPSYKKQRKAKPAIIDPIKEWLLENMSAEYEDNLEADDLLGLYQTEDTVIATIDKDLLQIPGRHYSWKNKALTTITSDEALRNFFCQVLSGDSTDNFSGCPGIGVKGARTIVDETATADLWDTVVCSYLAAGQTLQNALLMARIAYILHPGDAHDYLWEPEESTKFTETATAFFKFFNKQKGDLG